MAQITINTDASISDPGVLKVNHLSGETGKLIVHTRNGRTWSIDWGDGTVDTGLASGATVTHVFTADVTEISLNSSGGLEDITKILNYNHLTDYLNINENLAAFGVFTNLEEVLDNMGTWTGDLSGLPVTLRKLTITNCNVTAHINELPDTLETITLNNLTNLSGILADLPASSIDVNLTGVVNVGGVLSNLPSNINSLYISVQAGVNINGNIINLPASLTYLVVYGLTTNDIVGNLANLKEGFTTLNLSGNALSGNIDDLPSTMTSITLYGNNTVAGSIENVPNGLHTLVIHGNNNITGNIANIPASLGLIGVKGNNTILGNIDAVPVTLDNIFITGNNTISGNLGGIPNMTSGELVYYIGGNNTIQYSSSKDFSTFISVIIGLETSNAVLIPSQVDQLIADLVGAGDASPSLSIKGAGAYRTSASDADVATIESGGGQVTLTP